MMLLPGMDVYPLGSSFLEVIPAPLLAGLLAGMCFLVAAIALSLMTACYMKHRRELRHRKRSQCESRRCCGGERFWNAPLANTLYLLSPLCRSPTHPPDRRVSNVRTHSHTLDD